MKNNYDLILSIGQACGASMWLRGMNLQFSSYPFDWLACGPLSIRVELITTELKNILEEDYLIFIGAGKYHKEYKNSKNGICFLHDFSLTKDFKSSLKDVRRKYERRANRFYTDIKKATTILFVWYSNTTTTSKEEILNSFNGLKQKFNKDIDLLIIEHSECPYGKEIINENIEVYRVNTQLGAHDKVLGNTHVVGPIFKQLSSTYKPTFSLKLKQLFVPYLLKLAWKKRENLSARFAKYLYPHKIRRMFKKDINPKSSS